MKSIRLHDAATILTIAAVALSRLIPHWPNFTPVMAIALVGGALYADHLRSVAIPLIAMVLSDLVLGILMGSDYAFHDTQLLVDGPQHYRIY